MEETNTIWSYGSEDDLVRELLDTESQFFVLPEGTIESNSSTSTELSSIDFISSVYSGPTIQDIENALLTTSPKVQSKEISQARISLLERSLNKVENKYTLKIKSYGNGMADDGYKWRKYGQKAIKNSPNPRSYFRCTNPRCSAKKQVERSSEDPETLVITYEGLHLHFAYPFIHLNEPLKDNSPVKKSKKICQESQEPTQKAQEITKDVATKQLQSNLGDYTEEMGQGQTTAPQGLLEDVVPLTIRNPSNHMSSYLSASSSSEHSSPASPSDFSWCPLYPPFRFT